MNLSLEWPRILFSPDDNTGGAVDDGSSGAAGEGGADELRIAYDAARSEMPGQDDAPPDDRQDSVSDSGDDTQTAAPKGEDLDDTFDRMVARTIGASDAEVDQFQRAHGKGALSRRVLAMGVKALGDQDAKPEAKPEPEKKPETVSPLDLGYDFDSVLKNADDHDEETVRSAKAFKALSEHVAKLEAFIAKQAKAAEEAEKAQRSRSVEAELASFDAWVGGLNDPRYGNGSALDVTEAQKAARRDLLRQTRDIQELRAARGERISLEEARALAQRLVTTEEQPRRTANRNGTSAHPPRQSRSQAAEKVGEEGAREFVGEWWKKFSRK